MKQCLYCQDPLNNKRNNAKYCNDDCGMRYKRREVNEIKKGNCKYCKDPDHNGFCCNEHERTYNQIMRDIKIAKSKPKRKVSEEHEKGYRKIENFLNRPL